MSSDAGSDGERTSVVTEYVGTVDWDRTEPVSTAIVETVATATDRNPVTIPPLFDYIDTDALNRLFTGVMDGDVAFTFDDCAVRVTSSGAVTVTVQ